MYISAFLVTNQAKYQAKYQAKHQSNMSVHI